MVVGLGLPAPSGGVLHDGANPGDRGQGAYDRGAPRDMACYVGAIVCCRIVGVVVAGWRRRLDRIGQHLMQVEPVEKATAAWVLVDGVEIVVDDLVGDDQPDECRPSSPGR